MLKLAIFSQAVALAGSGAGACVGAVVLSDGGDGVDDSGTTMTDSTFESVIVPLVGKLLMALTFATIIVDNVAEFAAISLWSVCKEMVWLGGVIFTFTRMEPCDSLTETPSFATTSNDSTKPSTIFTFNSVTISSVKA